MMTAEHTTSIHQARTARGWSRARLAREAGITEQTIFRTERGHTVPSLETIQKIAAAFDLPPDALIRERAHAPNLHQVSAGTPDHPDAA
jgi:transcriptional regulator with XRE-family HTH domain